MPGKRASERRPVGSMRGWTKALRFRFFKRVHRRGQRALWAFDQVPVARGVAIGLFFGVMIPVAQIVAALFVAVAMRANLLAAALSTFVTNPFTLPFVYYYAYRIGSLLTDLDSELAGDVVASEEAADQALEVTGWLTTLADWSSSVAVPFLTGLVMLAVASALLGYALVRFAWSACRAARKYLSARSP